MSWTAPFDNNIIRPIYGLFGSNQGQQESPDPTDSLGHDPNATPNNNNTHRAEPEPISRERQSPTKRSKQKPELHVPHHSDTSNKKRLPISRTPVHNTGKDSVALVIESPPQRGMPRRPGWKPHNTLDGRSDPIAAHAEPPSTSFDLGRSQSKRKRTEEGLSLPNQHPSSHLEAMGAGGVNSKVQGTRALRSSVEANPAEDVSKIDELSIVDKSVAHIRDRGRPSLNIMKMAKQRDPSLPTPTNSKQPPLAMPEHNRSDRLQRKILPGPLIDYDKECFRPSNRTSTTKQKPSALDSIIRSVTKKQPSGILADKTENSKTDYEKKNDLSRGDADVRKSTQGGTDNSQKSNSMSKRKLTGRPIDRSTSPRLNEVFKRDVQSRTQDEEGDTDELVKSSPYAYHGGRDGTPNSIEQLGTTMDQPKSKLQISRTRGDFHDKHVSDADIPPSVFRRTKNVESMIESTHVTQAEKEQNLEGQQLLGLYVNSIFFEPPIRIYFLKDKPAFEVVDSNGTINRVFVDKIQKGLFSVNALHVKLETRRSEYFLEAAVFLTFGSEFGITWFAHGLRLRGLVHQVTVSDVTMEKIIQKRLHERERIMQPHNGSDALEEQHLLQRRVANNNQRILQQSSVARKGTSNLGVKQVASTSRLNNGLPKIRSSRTTLDRVEPGIDEIVYEDPGIKEVSSGRTRTTPKEFSDSRRSIGTANEGSVFSTEQDTNPSSALRPRSVRTRGMAGNELQRTPRPLSREQTTPVKFSTTGGLGPGWKKPLSYPLKGPNRATVDFSDLNRLDEGEFLNDNLIQFGLMHAYEHNRNQAKNVYMFNTYFYTSLTNGTKHKKMINYDAVKRWTSKIELFDYNYIIVPINENLHWNVAIICNVRNAKRSPILDSGSDEVDASDEPLEVSSASLPTTPTPNDHSENNASMFRSNHTDPEDTMQVNDLHVNAGSDDMISEEDDVDCANTKNVMSVPETCDNGESIDSIIEVGVTFEGDELPPEPSRKRRGVGVRKYDLDDYVIITFDSFGIPRSTVIRNLKEYLREEARCKRAMMMEDPKGITAKGIPLQDNYSDCGLFMVAYVRKFLHDPAAFVEKILQKEMHETDDWAGGINALQMRADMRVTIIEEHQKQHATPVMSSGQLSEQQTDDKKIKKEIKSYPESMEREIRNDRQTQLTANKQRVVTEPSDAQIVLPPNTPSTSTIPLIDRQNQTHHNVDIRQPSPSSASVISNTSQTASKVLEQFDVVLNETTLLMEEMDDFMVNDVDNSQGKASTEISDVGVDEDTDMLDQSHDGVDQPVTPGDVEMTDVPEEDSQYQDNAMLNSWDKQLEFSARGATTLEEDTLDMNRRSASQTSENEQPQ